MKFAQLALLGTAAATYKTQEEVDNRLMQIVEKNRLLKQKAEMQAMLSQIEKSIQVLQDAAATPAATDATAAPATDAAAATATATADAAQAVADAQAQAQGGNGLLIGGIVAGAVALGVVGFVVYKRRQAAKHNEGGEADLYSRFIQHELKDF